MYSCILGSKREINSMNLPGIKSSFNIKTFGMRTQTHSNNKTCGMLKELVQQLL